LGLYGRDIDIMYLKHDGLIKESDLKFVNSINFPPKRYYLTERGLKFIERWKRVKELDIE
jgi:predicted transcriptional regulator